VSANTATCERVVSIYKCLCDMNRLRILNLLHCGPRCVCHLEQVLEIGSVRTSQQLAFLRRHGMVEVEVRGTWRVYSLPAKPAPELAANLACLQDCIFEDKVFREDLVRLKHILKQNCGPRERGKLQAGRSKQRTASNE
jgi:ArsR family transcriptional regulator